MAFKFVTVSLAVMAVMGFAGAATAADPVRSTPAPAGPAGVNVDSSNRDHIDQDAQFKTDKGSPTNGIGGTGGGRMQKGGQDSSTINGIGGMGGGRMQTGSGSNSGTTPDKR